MRWSNQAVVVEGEGAAHDGGHDGQADGHDDRRPEAVERDAGQEVEHETDDERLEDDGAEPQRQHRDRHDHEGERRPHHGTDEADHETGEHGVARRRRSRSRRARRRGATASPRSTTVTTALRHTTSVQTVARRGDRTPRCCWAPFGGHRPSTSGTATVAWPSRPPGSSTRSRSPWPLAVIAAAKRSAGRSQPRRPARPLHRAVRAPVDGNDERGRISSLARAARCGSRWPGPSDCAPPADRQEGDVDGAEIGHAVEEVGVAGEVHRARAASAGRSRPPRPATGCAGRDRAGGPPGRSRSSTSPKRSALAGLRLDHIAEAVPAQPPARRRPGRRRGRRRATAATAGGGGPCGRGRSARRRPRRAIGGRR